MFWQLLPCFGNFEQFLPCFGSRGNFWQIRITGKGLAWKQLGTQCSVGVMPRWDEPCDHLMPPPSLPVTLYRGGSRQIGPRQIGPRQIGPLENLAANWAPANRALFGAQFAIFWQIGPRQIGPLGGKLGPGKSGPGRLGPLAANWAPEI